jgi:hypothetical protein
MTELMIKMTSWLIASMALGFLVAWLLSRAIYEKKEADIENNFSTLIFEQKNMFNKLEENFRNKKRMLEMSTTELTQSEAALAEKISLLTTLQNKLDNNSLDESNSFQSKEKNTLLFKKIQELEQSDIKRIKELDDFGEIVLLAEEKLEENEKSHQQILKELNNDIECLTVENKKNKSSMKAYLKTIRELEESLTLYQADSTQEEFIISKDQFIKIEEQLLIYQKEIKSLKHINKKSLLKSQIEDKTIKEQHKEGDDSSMVKVFRESYKKITNS